MPHLESTRPRVPPRGLFSGLELHPSAEHLSSLLITWENSLWLCSSMPKSPNQVPIRFYSRYSKYMKSRSRGTVQIVPPRVLGKVALHPFVQLALEKETRPLKCFIN